MWAKDGSGLDVKRIRGMTIPQADASARSRRCACASHESKRASRGRLSEVDVSAAGVRERRRRRIGRRTKRREESADLRADTLWLVRWRHGERCFVISREVLRASLRPFWRQRCAERFRGQAVDYCGQQE